MTCILGVIDYHVVTIFVDSCTYKANGKSYTRHLLRESFRENEKVRRRTVANLSHASDEEIQAKWVSTSLEFSYEGEVDTVSWKELKDQR